MALKDWKEESNIISGNRRIAWNNIKNHTARVIIFNPYMGDNPYYGHLWTLRIVDEYDNWGDKEYKTKSIAMSKAKSYMRTH